MNYQSTLEYLYGLTDYEKERIARYDPDTLDLTRVKRVLARLGDPQTRFPSIHIAGTKGKGSVAAMCAAALQAGGLQTGLYTSPHLHTFRERIRVDGKPISEEALVALMILGELGPSFLGGLLGHEAVRDFSLMEWLLHSSLEWPGPFQVYSGNWMLIDV